MRPALVVVSDQGQGDVGDDRRIDGAHEYRLNESAQNGPRVGWVSVRRSPTKIVLDVPSVMSAMRDGPRVEYRRRETLPCLRVDLHRGLDFIPITAKGPRAGVVAQPAMAL